MNNQINPTKVSASPNPTGMKRKKTQISWSEEEKFLDLFIEDVESGLKQEYSEDELKTLEPIDLTLEKRKKC